MPELTQEEKLKIFEKLPKELQNLMENEDTGAFLLYLGEKYDLDDDKVSLLSKLVGDVVLGITPITSMAQEINLKIATDSQVAMNLEQELYADLLFPVMSAAKPLPTPTPAPMPVPTAPLPQTTDQYRELANGAPARMTIPSGGPGIVDLRKLPLEPLRPTPPPAVKVEPPPTPPLPSPPLRPLTFTKPVVPIKPTLPLIEAEPHKIVPPPTPLQPMPQTQKESVSENKYVPQYIIRPPGLAPTDLPRNILDLKKDKGEF